MLRSYRADARGTRQRPGLFLVFADLVADNAANRSAAIGADPGADGSVLVLVDIPLQPLSPSNIAAATILNVYPSIAFI